jgi:hypothetical protein
VDIGRGSIFMDQNGALLMLKIVAYKWFTFETGELERVRFRLRVPTLDFIKKNFFYIGHI